MAPRDIRFDGACGHEPQCFPVKTLAWTDFRPRRPACSLEPSEYQRESCLSIG